MCIYIYLRVRSWTPVSAVQGCTIEPHAFDPSRTLSQLEFQSLASRPKKLCGHCWSHCESFLNFADLDVLVFSLVLWWARSFYCGFGHTHRRGGNKVFSHHLCACPFWGFGRVRLAHLFFWEVTWNSACAWAASQRPVFLSFVFAFLPIFFRSYFYLHHLILFYSLIRCSFHFVFYLSSDFFLLPFIVFHVSLFVLPPFSSFGPGPTSPNTSPSFVVLGFVVVLARPRHTKTKSYNFPATSAFSGIFVYDPWHHPRTNSKRKARREETMKKLTNKRRTNKQTMEQTFLFLIPSSFVIHFLFSFFFFLFFLSSSHNKRNKTPTKQKKQKHKNGRRRNQMPQIKLG